jgi:hypothetical protein
MYSHNRIKVNKGQCKKCGDVIESKHRHAYRECSCGATAVDGGKDYLKRVGEFGDFIELSEYTEERLND